MALLIPRASAHTKGAITRRELFLWLGCFLLLNQLAVASDISRGWSEAVAGLLQSKSVFYYLGWYAVFSLLLASDRDEPISRTDLTFALLAAVANLLPTHMVVWLVTTAVGVYLFIDHRGDRNLRAAAIVLLALAANGYWGRQFFDFFGYYLLRADAALVGSALSLTQPDMGWHDTIVGRSEGHSVLIYAPCSSFHNISLGLLCWVTVTKLFRLTWTRGDWMFALLVCVSVILINASRLYLMALSPQHYAYWHNGPGEQILAWGTTAAVLLISLWGALRGRDQS